MINSALVSNTRKSQKPTTMNSDATATSPALINLSYRELKTQRRANQRFIMISSAPAVWLNTFMITLSLGLMVYVGFTKELFFEGERNSEFVFAVTMSTVLFIWYVHLANQLLKIRKIEFFANDDGAYILSNRSRHDYYFVPWSRTVNHIVARGYYNGSAAAITLHTDFTETPDAMITRGSTHAVLENGRAHFSVIPKCFIRHEEMEEKVSTLRGIVATDT